MTQQRLIMAHWLCQLGFQGLAHYCIILIYCTTDFNNWQVSLIVHLFPVFYTDITIPDLIKPLKCLAIKPVTLNIYKKSIKIKIVCSLSKIITENMGYTGGLGGSSFSVTPIPKAEYHLLGSIFPFHITFLIFFMSFFRWIFTYKVLNHAPTRCSLFRILIFESLINLELLKSKVSPHSRSWTSGITSIHPHFPVLQGLHWQLPSFPQISNNIFFIYCLTT